FVDQKYDIIVTVGFKLGDATIKAAKANPNIKFMMVDFADFADKTPPSNLLGLLFKEDQPGYLAGVLAGSLTKTNTLGVVAGLQTVPPVVHYVEGFKNGAKSVNSGVKVLTIYQPESGAKDFNDPDWGKQQALTFFGQHADIVFGVGGNTGNGALVAAKEQGKMLDGVDLVVDWGRVHALLGENGAGKSTLMNVVYGMVTSDAGEIEFDGRPVHIAGPQDAIKLGIGMVHQHFMLIPRLSVVENIMLGHEIVRGAGVIDMDKAAGIIGNLA